MTNQFLPPQYSKILKDLGFNQDCLAWYSCLGDESLIRYGSYPSDKLPPRVVLAPTYLQAEEFLFDRFQVVIVLHRDESGRMYLPTPLGLKKYFLSPVDYRREAIHCAIDIISKS